MMYALKGNLHCLGHILISLYSRFLNFDKFLIWDYSFCINNDNGSELHCKLHIFY